MQSVRHHRRHMATLEQDKALISMTEHSGNPKLMSALEMVQMANLAEDS